MGAADSFVVSTSSSRRAPRMPLRAASTLTLRARASAITAEAVALMTAVTPPLWAYSRVPWGIDGFRWGAWGRDTVKWRGWRRHGQFTPGRRPFLPAWSDRCDWYFLERRVRARERRPRA